jgi:PAS domain S-box-containing protein
MTTIFQDDYIKAFGTATMPWSETAPFIKPEFTAKRKDGTLVPTEPRFSAWETPDGTFVTAIIRDITERKNAEHKLEEGERRIRELTDALPDILYETDTSGTVTFANATLFVHYGYTKEDVVGAMKLLDFIAPFDRKRAQKKISERIRGEDKGWVEYALIKKDGSMVPCAVRSMPIIREGVYAGLRGIAVDISERKRTEEALARSERRIREMTDALPVIVYETDVTGRFTFANAAVFQLFGYTKKETEAMKFDDLVVTGDKERAKSVFRARMSGKDVGRVEYTGLRKNGTTLNISVRSVLIKQGDVATGQRGVIVDITERKIAEEALERELALSSSVARLSTPIIAPTSNLKDIAVALLDEALRLTESEDGFVSYVNPLTKELIVLTSTPMMFESGANQAEQREIRFPVGQDGSYPEPWGHALNSKTAFYVNTSPPPSLVAPTHADVKQLVEVPALIGADAVGQIALINPGRDYTERDLEAIKRLADVYSLAVVRMRAEKMLEERTDTIEMLNRIMVEGNQAPNVQSFAKTVTDLTLELLHFDAGAIHVNDRDALTAKMRYAIGIPTAVAEALRKVPLDQVPYANMLVESAPLFVDDPEGLRVPLTAELGLKSLAIVPLSSYDKHIGALSVASFARHTFSQAEKEVLIAIGNEAGAIIAKLQADELIKATLAERETLLKEIHHRVKNNMQIVSSLLSLQAATATEQETTDALKESQRRIRSMALIHEKLYGSGSLAAIDFGDYVKSLASELLRTYSVNEGTTITTDIDDIRLSVDIAIPCALIINELVSNAIKYAFPNGRPGEIIIAVKRASGADMLTIADDGVGLPADLDIEKTESLGLQLVTGLVNQLDGSITLDRTKGTTYTITFKPLDVLSNGREK